LCAERLWGALGGLWGFSAGIRRLGGCYSLLARFQRLWCRVALAPGLTMAVLPKLSSTGVKFLEVSRPRACYWRGWPRAKRPMCLLVPTLTLNSAPLKEPRR